jgi:hypothetical protein
MSVSLSDRPAMPWTFICAGAATESGRVSSTKTSPFHRHQGCTQRACCIDCRALKSCAASGRVLGLAPPCHFWAPCRRDRPSLSSVASGCTGSDRSTGEPVSCRGPASCTGAETSFQGIASVRSQSPHRNSTWRDGPVVQTLCRACSGARCERRPGLSFLASAAAVVVDPADPHGKLIEAGRPAGVAMYRFPVVPPVPGVLTSIRVST